MKNKKWYQLDLEQKRNYAGYLFVLPFLIGFALFFLYPFIQSIMFSLSELEISSGGFELHYKGLSNYYHSLFIHTSFVRIFIETISKMLADVPLILTFAFFAAIILNQDFKGRMLARVIFFLPVIMGSGIVLMMEQSDYLMGMLQSGQGAIGEQVSGTAALRQFLYTMKFPEGLLEYISSAVDRIPIVIRSSGIQILIFLAGLQSIPASLYEASNIEGATGWENFWKITFPLMTPLILTNLVYTIIDTFTAPSNGLVSLIKDTAFGGAGYGVSTAMSWIYFLAVFIILTVAIGIISRSVFYQE